MQKPDDLETKDLKIKTLPTPLDNFVPKLSQDLEIPNWGIKDYIRERAIWQKGVESLTGEPGWFYFKIFFKFNTNYGLFGGILEDENNSINTAIQYLENCKDSYTVNQIAEKQIALLKFVGSLSYINENAPWFFNSITGLDKANSVKINEPFKNNEIEIGVKEDAVDMRLTTLFELYKYACFDNVNLKEIIPENLRKFDMTILVFHVPLRYYQTGFQSMRNGTHEYKSFNSEQFGDRMSYLMFTFANCEFDIDSINSVIPGEISNETAFNLGKSNFKIKYKRVYKHTSNEWSKIFFGDGSNFVDNGKKYKSQSDRIGAIITATENKSLEYYNRTADIYKPMVDAVEKEANDIMRTIDPKIALGNIYWGNAYGQSRLEKLLDENDKKNSLKYKVRKSINSIINGEKNYSMGVGSEYFQAKLDLIKYGDEALHGNNNSNKVKSEKELLRGIHGDKRLHGRNPYMPGTPYFEHRLKREKRGDSSLHDYSSYIGDLRNKLEKRKVEKR